MKVGSTGARLEVLSGSDILFLLHAIVVAGGCIIRDEFVLHCWCPMLQVSFVV